MMPERERQLPWARPWPWLPGRGGRCWARTERRPSGLFMGRCELAEHGEDVDHALERGADTPRWSTKWTG